MHCFLALGLLVALCASANAATLHRAGPRHVVVRPAQGAGPAQGAARSGRGQIAVTGWTDEQTKQWLNKASEGAYQA